MKAISNINDLTNIFLAETPNWKESIYEATGVIPIFKNNSVTLFSNCGYIDLDDDSEYKFSKGEDLTEYCLIHSMDDFIKYILGMDSYKSKLCDTAMGEFHKSELFWAIYYCLILVEGNQSKWNGSMNQDWGLYSIVDSPDAIDLNMALVDYDLVEIEVKKDKFTTLSDVLHIISEEMNDIIITSQIDTIPKCQVDMETGYHVPNTFDELMAQISASGAFAWLTS